MLSDAETSIIELQQTNKKLEKENERLKVENERTLKRLKDLKGSNKFKRNKYDMEMSRCA